ncbi:MAG: ABC-type Fe3+-siderophore transport system, periplasmic iron-binding component [Chloroflexi bacterium AL-W]|nr:ABC-type Fe3+-siderophore transport system, periplasmic iron-binding component [Chloroflexi bacterium AL-N1]NOK70750.1 ABC-type Fe3+-siderophore transport system, periplasmic iron-binding component [Chloroflexi bacterium AL-N10]NOK78310.1 ABC-type Fe3+-siderophore transport system, periplasmic iron-binding component [Chloroflexi bacterium AL-N5]NOK85653.1 ABC-type Fe3+-siderophore transport system, periplasmic iron-binding component [Chloroflexi bacterium AL-W]NOK92567.1 ABC-type Fe3+-sidero
MTHLHRLMVALFAAVLMLTACGGQQSAENVPEPTEVPEAEAPESEVAEEPSEESETTVSTEGFPRTIEHKYGSTTIEEVPERVVTVGLFEQDVLLALGIVPVGTTEYFGGYPGAIWPWAQDELEALGGDVPDVVGGADGINFEAITALNPDLILALYSGLTAEEYELLTQIVPTVAQPSEYVDYGVPWQELTVTVGQTVGQEAEAQELVDDLETRFVQIPEEHPEFVGATSVVATLFDGIYLYGPEDARGRLLTSLGFTLPDIAAEVAGDSFGGNLSTERADLLDLDVVIWLADPAQADEVGGPVYQSLPVHTEGREIFLSNDEPLGGATSFVSVLSLPYLLDELVPQLAEAVEQ